MTDRELSELIRRGVENWRGPGPRAEAARFAAVRSHRPWHLLLAASGALAVLALAVTAAAVQPSFQPVRQFFTGTEPRAGSVTESTPPATPVPQVSESSRTDTTKPAPVLVQETPARSEPVAEPKVVVPTTPPHSDARPTPSPSPTPTPSPKK